MNRRQWKKACKKAAERLAREFPGEFTIVPADGEECLYSPRGYEPRRAEGSIGRRYTEAPRGTPLIWERVSYEYDEWEARTALEVYAARRHAEDFDWAAAAAALPALPAIES